MEQKLLAFVSRRTAWILLGACIAFWVVSAAGFLEAPLGTPPTLMFLWMYCNLMAALASTLVTAAAVAALVLHRRAVRPEPDGTAAVDGREEVDTKADGPEADDTPEADRKLRLRRR